MHPCNFNDINFKFTYKLKQIKPEGFMAYEYNPLRNFRSSTHKMDEDGNIVEDNEVREAEVFSPGTILDLNTDKLEFSLNNPVSIIPQPSYDGSVNLILTDGNSPLKLINSRFTCLPSNRYKIVDREGNLDTNLYDLETFQQDTSLYKTVNDVPKVVFNGLQYNGNFKVGNYNFYFRLSDADGNESDFVAESGVVTCHIGNINSPGSIRGGIADENSYKSIQFSMYNLDSSYDYVIAYYTRNTSDIDGIRQTTAYRIDKRYRINNSRCNLLITGFENSQQISLDDINIQYFLADKAKTLEVCQNRLFLGNVHKPVLDNTSLKKCSNLILPYYKSESARDVLGEVTPNGIGAGMYYNADNIYYKIGYWDTEIYKIGIVWIMPDGSLSSVFGTRGKEGIPEIDNINDAYTEKYVDGYEDAVFENAIDKYQIDTTDEGFIVDGKENENVHGVISIKDPDTISEHRLYSLGIKIPKDVIDYLEGKVLGFFIVRQKRIPTVLAQAMITGYDSVTNLPLIPTSANKGKLEAISDSQGYLVNDYTPRVVEVAANSYTAICPEYDIRQPYFNNLFTGVSFSIDFFKLKANFPENSSSNRHLAISNYSYNNSSVNSSNTNSIIAVGDNVPVIKSDITFRGRAGEAEEAYKHRATDSGRIIRGSFGPYLGLPNFNSDMLNIINIRIPNYDRNNYRQYFLERFDDESPFYAISDRYSLTEILEEGMENRNYYINDIYRGDCFICNFTHRVNRNFQDPEAPNNDEIVDSNTWKSNYTKGDSEKNAKINRGDVNAVQLGNWITFTVCSNYNLSMRNTNDSYVSEEGLTGTPRTFFPLSDMQVTGNYKIPESFVLNTGLSSTVSERYNYALPDVPYIKNEFGTRIIYSDIAVNDAFKNGFRTFQASNYRDYPMTYGGIVKLVELYGSLLCVFEHGVALIPVNERVQAGDGAGGNVYINTSNVLPENPKMLSDMFGSQWLESIIKTPYYVYGVDTVAKKVWRTNGQTFEVISDFKIQKFLNDNITLTERELTPIIGIRNVKTHYNAFKGDVMFTFYDNLYGFEEKAWNICYNEVLQRWVTLYSWIPSYSENIDNIYFSFNRHTSKLISKLGTSKKGSTNADGIILTDVILTSPTDKVGFDLINRAVPNDTNTAITKVHYDYSLVDDNFGNYSYFTIGTDPSFITDCNDQGQYLQFKFDPSDPNKYKSKDVWLLNVKVKVSILEYDTTGNIKQYIDGWNEFAESNYGYYQSVLAVSSKAVLDNQMLTEEDRNLPNLNTDFWKHGKSGIIDIKEEIKPCYWYGEQHPFEFEFVVADKPGNHKIFNNLQIISNKAKPESFHYEIVGEVYDWAHDKRNIYWRQEYTKQVYQNLGSDILYNVNFDSLKKGRWVIVKNPITNKNELHYEDTGLIRSVKSTIFPWYYERIDTFNDVYDVYQLATSKHSRDYQNLSGTEVVWDKQLNEFRLLTHVRGNDFHEAGRLRGNMQYQEDIWLVEIPPIYFRQKNEVVDQFGNPIKSPDWNGKNYPPLVLNNVPNDIKEEVLTTKNLPKFN